MARFPLLIEVNAEQPADALNVARAPSEAMHGAAALAEPKLLPPGCSGDVGVARLSEDAPMSAFIYCCPNTGKYVQGWTAEDPYEGESDAGANADAYESVRCNACMRLHLVNPKTGKVLGADDK